MMNEQQKTKLKESMQRAFKTAHIVHKNKPLKKIKTLKAKIVNNTYIIID